MQKYVEEFLNRYHFDEEGKRVALSTFAKFSKEDIENILAVYPKTDTFHFEALTSLVMDLSKRTCAHEYTIKWIALIILAKRMEQFYTERGIDKQIAVDTLRDLEYKYKECMDVYHVHGVFAWEWYICIYTLQCFTLGRLDFELAKFRLPSYEKNGCCVKEGDRVLSIHIPNTGTPLSVDACKDAFSRASVFFADTFACEKIPFVCWSWLLYPANKKILSPKSNISAFMDLFDIIEEEDYESWDQVAWRIFSVADMVDPNLLPENTSLQRAYKQHLCAGGKFGWGYGICFR